MGLLGLPDLFWWLIVISAVICLLGFYKDVYFFSVAYPFAVVAMALTILIACARNLTPLLVVHLALLIVWGLRLGRFILERAQTSSYLRHQQRDPRGGMSMSVRVLVWVLVSVLYAVMVTPALLGPVSDRDLGPIGTSDQIVGLVLMAAGCTLEAWADQQKSAAKEREPDAVVTGGLYGWVRCPNYLGEIVFWLGNLIAGLPYIASFGQGFVAVLGLLALVFIMLGATKRLEAQQRERYGDDPEFNAWVLRVPILFPWTPVYSFDTLPLPKL
ncbi:DUF1295 domain-containing protein [Nigerium massiliense]|uniref:DUF1295 domain-containing protein n=1 Tax=Nigerium massiliense TaxID=1522317 RepID=UPI00058FD619|nr:DUF1295 domain-containing protein [Nigerium massiliense]